MRALTERQLTILKIVGKSIIQLNYPPTWREIRNQMGFSSTNAITCHLQAIEKKGYLSWTHDNKKRTLFLTELGEALLKVHQISRYHYTRELILELSEDEKRSLLELLKS